MERIDVEGRRPEKQHDPPDDHELSSPPLLPSLPHRSHPPDERDRRRNRRKGYRSHPSPPLPPPPLPASIPAPNPHHPQATTTTTTDSKAKDPNDVVTPPFVPIDYHNVKDPLCPRPSAPPLEMLVEDGHFDEEYAISRSLQMSQQMSHPPPKSCGAAGKRRGVEGGGGTVGTVGEVKGHNRQGWTLVPPPAAAAATRSVYDPRVESSAATSAALNVPIARATMLGDMPVCKVMETPSSDHVLAQSRYNNIEEGGGMGDGGGGGNSGKSDDIPVCSIRCGRFVKIGLMSCGLVVMGAIIAVVVMMVGFKRDDPTSIIIVNGNGTSNDAIVTETASATTSTAATTTASTSAATTTSSISSTTTSMTTPVITTAAIVSSSWRQQGAPIKGDGADDYFGRSVALSADGGIIAIGADGYNDHIGYVKVYHIDDDGENSVQLGQTIYGNAIDDELGYSVDITPDGMTIVCGSPGGTADNNRPGYVKVFSLEGDFDLSTDNWKQIGQNIIGEANGDVFGYSVSISEDGKTIAVGAPENDGINGFASGHVRIYGLVDDSTSWEQIGEDIDGEEAVDYSGQSVSMSADGSTVAIGAPWNDNNGLTSGQVTVHRINVEGSSWEQLGQSMYGINAGDRVGRSVNLSPDGNTLAIGSPEGGAGYVRVFSLTSGDGIDAADSWKQVGQDIVGSSSSVSLSDDGKTLAVGRHSADGKNGGGSGSVSVYRMNETESNWIQIGDDIDGEAAGDGSGFSVSLSADGYKVAIGSPYNGGNASGHVRVYVLE